MRVLYGRNGEVKLPITILSNEISRVIIIRA